MNALWVAPATTLGSLHVTPPSVDADITTSVSPGPRASCHAAYAVPSGAVSNATPGSSRVARPLSGSATRGTGTYAMRIGSDHVAPPSVERNAAAWKLKTLGSGFPPNSPCGVHSIVVTRSAPSGSTRSVVPHG